MALAAIPCLLLASGPGNSCNALSLSSTSSTTAPSRSLVDQARMIRELKNKKTRRGELLFMDDTKPLNLDNDALSAALFDDDFTNSLESAVAKKNGAAAKKKSSSSSSAKSRAEEFDRFMEEDATVAFIVQENIKPGSLVDDVQQSRGADIVNMEAFLQKEAADRRKSREVKPIKVKTTNASSTKTSLMQAPLVKVTRKTKLASRPASSETLSPPPSTLIKKSKPRASTLLTREQEYALAYTIQAGTRVHKLKAAHEKAQSAPVSKKEWAALADLSPNELRKLISEYRTAKQELVASNMGLVHAVVRSYSRKARYRGMPMEELVQEGSLGLIRAAELFDPAKGLRFSTYATIWIKGILSNSNSLDDVITLPSREKVLWNKVRGAWEEMAMEAGDRSTVGKGGKPSVSSAKEIAQRLGMKTSLVEKNMYRMGCISNVLSLDYQYTSTARSGYSDGKQEALMNSAQFGTDADLAEQTQFKADVVSGLVRNLTERELTLMRLRYGLEDGKECTVKECAAIMGINRETARTLQHACLKKLREASNMESLQEYLLTVA
eukprot:CAMPEP_0172323710 /NCGR_PEP_ID=MMETSP1058-20130122/49438_1 /TAXON_ID=83371 /ORGANISM="Detonula confervacea, Strain CCMP 353" /LENGTH=552 /DNA_ID=CAMNT_0013039787 /DNA_START=247 /DNA_END=1905 /DNA_ORIENTATION=+